MEIQWFVFAGILIVNAMAALAIAVILARRPARPGIHALTCMLVGLGLWSFSYAMITLSPTLGAKHFWLKLENIGILTVPVLWFLFTIRHTRPGYWLTDKPVILLLGIIPVISLVFLFSEQWFRLYYTSTHIAMDSGGPLIITRGPWYWVPLIQSYSLNFIGVGLLLWRFIKSRHIYRRQTITLIGAVVVPFSLNIIYQLKPGIIPFFSVPVDVTPLSFNVTAILLAASIFGLRLFELMPIARDTVMEYIPEMVFVVDSFDRLVDANSMAQKRLGKSIAEISGRDPVEVFREWPQLLNRFFFTEYSSEEIQIPGDPPRTLELMITPIYNHRTHLLEGRVIVAHDVTDRKLLENKLTETNESLTEQLAENENLRAQLQEQAIRDPLTGAYNRRFFAEALDKETARAGRENTPFSIIIMDVDHFKLFNDTHGHKCGDVVLQNLTQFLYENTRHGDIVCRYGGEEFVILMPDAPLEAAYERAELLRTNFEKMIVDYDGIKLNTTFSAGIASHPMHATNGDALLIMADNALYQSKSNGRNRVTIYQA